MNHKYMIWYKNVGADKLEVIGCDDLLISKMIWTMLACTGDYVMDSDCPV